MKQGTKYLNRPPRIQHVFPYGQFEIPAPPSIETSNNQMMLQLLLPLVSIVGYVLVGALGQGGATSLVFVLPMSIAVLSSSYINYLTYRQSKRIQDQKQAAYSQRLLQLRDEITLKHNQQRLFFLYNHPDPEYVLRIDAEHGNNSRFGPRLWERRVSDPDFGAIRLGVGTVTSFATYQIKGAESGDAPQMKEALDLENYARYVEDVPITINLRHNAPIGSDGDKDDKDKKDAKQEAPSSARHALGIVCEANKRQHSYALMAAVLTQFAAFHPPNDARIMVIGSSAVEQDWQWIKDLVHCGRNKPGDQIRFEQAPTPGSTFVNDADVDVLLRSIRTDLDRRKIRMSEKNSGESMLPFLLLVIDMQALPEATKLRDIETKPAVATILENGHRLGAAVIFLVSEAERIPGQCQAIIEVDTTPEKNVELRYVEVGINTLRYNNVRTDQLNLKQRETVQRINEFIKQISQWRVRSDSSSILPTTITILEMFRADTIEELEVMSQWRNSRKVFPKEGDHWLRAPVGVTAGNDLRELIVSADNDGVHGMIAGTTGSGKSELLLTLILGMGMRYDPSVLNFVLVDYKGGTAFEQMRRLPHCVDIVTNLQGTAGARTFTAIKAEMNRRQALLARPDVNSPNIANYRSRGLHDTVEPFPFLFVIIDEFAEMVKEMPDFKTELDSITRLGRALGVTLILATQRPAGVVTDQMRANMKFRICLRVETGEDSRELLGRSDAAFLPTSISGRAYLQIGNENLEMTQVGYTGQQYEWGTSTQDDVIFLDEIDAKQPQPEESIRPAQKTSDALLDYMKGLAEANRDEIPQQYCPWPPILPARLPLNYLSLAENQDPQMHLSPRYLRKADIVARLKVDPNDAEKLALNPALTDWLKANAPSIDLWRERGTENAHATSKSPDWWRKEAVRTYVGLVDNPARAEQIPFVIDLKQGPAVMFGTSGSGKTTFLRTLVMGLAAMHRPDELNFYLIDFGGRGLETLKDLPHITPLRKDAALDESQTAKNPIIFPIEEERLQRLIRLLNIEMEARKRRLGDQGTDSLFEYNASMIAKDQPELTMPCIVVIIDGFAQLRENFDYLLDPLTGLIRDGRANGIHFVVTADQRNAIPGKLYNLFTERFALKLTENADYVDVVTKSMPVPLNTPGRGYLLYERVPLECQVALPCGLSDFEVDQEKLSESDKIRSLTKEMFTIWEAYSKDNVTLIEKGPMPVNVLPSLVPLQSMLANVPRPLSSVDQVACAVPIGIHDIDLKPNLINLRKRGPHCVLVGPPESGKTFALRSWILSLAELYSPDQIRMVLIDSTARLFKDDTGSAIFAELPHVLKTISEVDQMEWLLPWLEKQYKPSSGPSFKTFIFIDNYDFFRDELNLSDELLTKLASKAKQAGPLGLHFIAAGSMTILRLDNLIKRIWEPRFGFALRSAEAVDALNGKVPSGMRNTEPPVGRAVMIKPGVVELLHIARPFTESETDLAQWITRIKDRHPNVEDVSDVDYSILSTGTASASSNGNGAVSSPRDEVIAPINVSPSPYYADAVNLSSAQLTWIRQQLTKYFESVEMDDMILNLKSLSPADLYEYAVGFGFTIPSPAELGEG